MSKEEPAWRADLEASIRKFDAYSTKEWLQLLEPHILAAEQRGRQQALAAVKAEIEVFRDNLPGLKARESWKLGYEGGLVALSVLIDSITPDSS